MITIDEWLERIVDGNCGQRDLQCNICPFSNGGRTAGCVKKGEHYASGLDKSREIYKEQMLRKKLELL